MIRFSVRGIPVPQGSSRGFFNARAHRVVITSDNQSLKGWRNLVATVAQQHAPSELWTDPVSLGLLFRLPMPKSRENGACTCTHLLGRHRKMAGTRTGCRNCPCTDYHPAKVWPSGKPDLDKLVRSIGDALTGIILKDDSRIVAIQVVKEYGTPGVEVSVAKVVGFVHPFVSTDPLFRPVTGVLSSNSPFA